MSRYKVEREVITVLLSKKQINSVLSVALDRLRKEQEKSYGPWKHDSMWETICDKLIQSRMELGVVPDHCRVRATSGNEVVAVLFERRQVRELWSAIADRVDQIQKSHKSYLVRQHSMVNEERHLNDIWDIVLAAEKAPAIAV